MSITIVQSDTREFLASVVVFQVHSTSNNAIGDERLMFPCLTFVTYGGTDCTMQTSSNQMLALLSTSLIGCTLLCAYNVYLYSVGDSAAG